VTDRLVLLVDDEDDIRLVAQACLERLAGWRVLAASSGREAIELARANRPDAILLDVMMPEMDGPTTLGHLRADPATSAVPVVFLTAKAQAGDRAALEALGASAILTKPFDPLALAAEISAALGWV
jgi:two-component system alkaline phosphatase synthesis response regulator PhoP